MGSTKLMTCAAIVIACVTLLACSHAPIHTTVDKLATHPQKYDGLRVEVSGRIYSNGMDRSVITDPSCPKKIVSYTVSNDVAEKPDVAPLIKAIYGRVPLGTAGKHITGTLIGTFSYKKDDWPGGTIFVENVRDLNVVIEPEPKHLNQTQAINRLAAQSVGVDCSDGENCKQKIADANSCDHKQ